MIDLRPDQLKIVQVILQKYIPSLEVRAFGSRVNGTAKRHSDLDLAIMTEEAIPSKVMGNLREAFATSDLPMRVDIIDWSRANPSFRKIVSEKYEVVQG